MHKGTICLSSYFLPYIVYEKICQTHYHSGVFINRCITWIKWDCFIIKKSSQFKLRRPFLLYIVQLSSLIKTRTNQCTFLHFVFDHKSYMRKMCTQTTQLYSLYRQVLSFLIQVLTGLQISSNCACNPAICQPVNRYTQLATPIDVMPW